MRRLQILAVVALLQQQYLPVRIIPFTTVLSPSDITYLGPCRVTAPGGADTSGSYGGMGGRKVGGVIRLFFWGIWGSDPTHPGKSGLYEMSDCVPTGTNYLTSPQLSIVTDWGYIDHGKKLNWIPSGCVPIADNAPLPGGIYFNESNQLLYSTYYTSYSGDPGWNLLATSLDNPGTAASTTYGPFRPKMTDGDGTVWYGAQRFTSMLMHPTSGKMLGSEGTRSINTAQSWGPSLSGGGDWPISSTPAGCGNPDLNQPDRYLNYYFPTNVNQDGSWTGNLRSFLFDPTKTYAQETWGPNYQNQRINPALNGGVGSWTDELSAMHGGYWFEGAHKQGFIFAGQAPLAASTDTADCVSTSHEWYRNAGNGFMDFASTPSPQFVYGETITGGTSGAVGSLTATPVGSRLGWQQSVLTDFTVGEHVIGATSGANAVMTLFRRQEFCTHLCPSLVQVTGPVSTQFMPLMVIYSEDKINAVKNGTATDWQQTADSITDMRATYGIKVASLEQLQASSLQWGYFDTATNNFYMNANSANDEFGNTFLTTLVHKFHINDSVPAPDPWPLLVMSVLLGLALWGRRRSTLGVKE